MFIAHTSFELCFKEEWEPTTNVPRPGLSAAWKMDEKIQNIGKLIRENCHLNVRALAEVSGINSVHQILYESFKVHKLCAKMLPKLHSRAKGIENELLRKPFKQHWKWFRIVRVITCDESFFTYDPETKKLSMNWNRTNSPWPKVTEVLIKLTDAHLQHSFKHWKIRMACFRDRQGEYWKR